MTQLALELELTPSPRLDNYVAAANVQALAHLRRCAADPLRSAIPTYLWGDTGCGKTHLLRAVAREVEALGQAVGWLDPHLPEPPLFDEAWSVLLMDDCDLLPPAFQAMAFNWFVNAQTPIQGRPRWVLAAGAAPPAELKLREDLRTRLGWGEIFYLHPVNETDCRLALRQAADERGLYLSDDVMAFMLNHFSRDLGSLMELLAHLDSYALRTKRAITIPLIKSMLQTE
jgi:DnaA-homolog protein